MSMTLNGNGTISGLVAGGIPDGSMTNATNATTAAACSGNAATATTAAACSGNAATATTAAACSGNAATATTASGLSASTDLSGLTQFGRMLTSSGYQKLPGGLIIQWGSSYSSGPTSTSYSYPIAFPAGVYLMIGKPNGSSSATGGAWSTSASQFSVSTSVGVNVDWIALGH